MTATPQPKSKKIFSFLWKTLCVCLIITVLAGGFFHKELARLYHVITLFDKDKIVHNFRHMDTLFDTREIKKGPLVYDFNKNPRPLPKTFVYENRTFDTRKFIDDTWTTGLLVIKDDAVIYESYFRGNTASSRSISWSMGKSMVSALVGIAVREGKIKDLDTPVSDYVPLLKKSGYTGVSLKNVLQMSSGIRFNEDYADFSSDINRMSRAFALNTPMDEFVVSLAAEKPAGTYNHYVSMDTQVLGMVLRETTGTSLSQYLEENIWKKIGMESDACWIIDNTGMELAFGGLNVVLRDYARFGYLYLNMGRFKDEQIIPAQWITDSITPDAPHLMPGNNPNSGWVLGYGYQWWIPENPEGDYLAIGIYNQFIYIHPSYHTVIVKLSAYPDYDNDGEEKELQSIQLFRTIAKTM